MTLVAAGLLANGFLWTQALTDAFADQSRDEPPEPSWFQGAAHLLLYGGPILVFAGVWPMVFGWAKVRAKTMALRRRPVVAEPVGDEDTPLMPPGFFGPAAKTRRVGAAPLVGFTFLGLVLLAGAAALLVLGSETFQQTIRMNGRGLRTAVFWGQLVKFVALPSAAFAATSLAMAWGRWFPLGEVEVVETKSGAAPRAATGYRFDQA